MMEGQTENKTLAALIKLLDEPDEPTFMVVRDRILSMGGDALALLEKSLEYTFDTLAQDRIQYLIRRLSRENLYIDFINWLNLGHEDLLAGFILVTRTQYPSLDEKEIIARIEQLKVDIWIELHDNLTALENIKVMNHILFEVHQFDGNKSDMSAPQNSYANTLLETRKGSPLSLGILYIILARRLGLPVYGVNLPQHFILAYLTEPGLANPSEDDVLFYLNPFNKGAVFTRREIEIYIKQMKIKADRSFYSPCTNAEIIRRLIRNLIYSYNQYGYPDKIEELENLLTAFE